MRNLLFIAGSFLLLATVSHAQNIQTDSIHSTNFPTMKEIVSTPIPGAPVLSQPQRIDGTLQEIRTEKHGLIYPAFFDWNHDGKMDLLLGEFETGETGSYIKVYLNEGTNSHPKYSGKYFYATDLNGEKITNYQWCCIGIHPRLVDLDGDGYLDILSGQYNPGKISWWRGTKDGFMPRQYVPQVGEDKAQNNDAFPRTDIRSNSYWNYTSANFADFDGDGRLDLFVGGSGGLRVAKNIGLNGQPKFSYRKDLYYVDGTSLSGTGSPFEISGSSDQYKTYMTPVDWDGDGVLDLLVTNNYTAPGQNPVEFLKGVKTSNGLRFEKPVPLFTAKDGGKAFPGCQPMIAVTDYNNDGIKDLVIGISIPTINGFEVADSVAWQWVRKMGIEMPGKDAGRVTEIQGLDKMIQEVNSNDGMRSYYLGKLTDYKYLTMRHRGYVFVMYGSKGTTGTAVVHQTSTDTSIEQKTVAEQKGTNQKVTCKLILPPSLKAGKTYTAEVVLTFADGWHAYSDCIANTSNGYIPTVVNVSFPSGIKKVGKVTVSSDASLYMGAVSFKQSFVCNALKSSRESEKLQVKATVDYQVCDSGMCLPPSKITLKGNVLLK